MKRTIVLIRHGQTTWNVEHRVSGQSPGVALTDIGRQQANRLAEALIVLPISVVISSPLERAQDTADFIARGRNLSVQLEPDLTDTDGGSWAGQVMDELFKNDPAFHEYMKDPTVAPEGVETFPQVQQRAVAAVQRWLARDDIGAYLAFVAHSDVVMLLIAHYLGLEVKQPDTLRIDNASVSLVELEKDQPSRVLSIGWSPQPSWLKLPVPQTAGLEEQKQEQEVSKQKA